MPKKKTDSSISELLFGFKPAKPSRTRSTTSFANKCKSNSAWAPLTKTKKKGKKSLW